MNSYLINFAAYSFAMVGFILTIFFVYKKSINPGVSKKEKDFLKIENTLKLSPVKTIYVIKAGTEKFLIAGDSANTTMLAKLKEETCENNIMESEKIREFEPLKIIKDRLMEVKIR